MHLFSRSAVAVLLQGFEARLNMVSLTLAAASTLAFVKSWADSQR